MKSKFQKELLQKKLLQKLLVASNEISEKQRNGVGNYMITNSEVANVINDYQERERKKELRLKKLKRLIDDEEKD